MLGEETVLLKALEGKRGQPEQRPPHPTEDGLFDRPTVVNNVQTLAAVPWIIRNGAPRYAAIGAKGSPGTDPRPGPRTAAARASPRSRRARRSASSSTLAGGLAGGHPLKALLVGGPSGGLLPPDLARHPRTSSMRCAPSARTSAPGSVVVADDRACVVDLARSSPGSAPTRRAARRSPAASACAGWPRSPTASPPAGRGPTT